MKSLSTKAYVAATLPVQLLGVQILSLFPEGIETYYSNGLYPWTAKAERFVFSKLPFSFGDIFYGVLVVMLIRWVVRIVRKHYTFRQLIIEIGATLAVVYAFFHLLWGFNYYRQPLHQVMGFGDEYTQSELERVTTMLIQRTNKLHGQLQANDSLGVVVPYSKAEIFDKTLSAYDNLSRQYPQFTYEQPCIKTSLISLLLSYMGFSGYLNPITNEAHVNRLIPTFKYPTTSCHEEAHQLGFAAENEANFIAALATTLDTDPYFEYCGTAFALRFCVNELYRRFPEKGICFIENIKYGVLCNYDESRNFWITYENPVNPVLHSAYDSYLKANNQGLGLDSYSYVVALLVNYYKDEVPAAL